MIKYSIKQFTQNRIIKAGFPLLCAVLLLPVIYHYCRYDTHLDVLSIVQPLRLAIRTSPVFFLGTMFFSYEYYYSAQRYSYQEVLLSSKEGRSPRVSICRFTTILCFCLAFIAVLTALLCLFFFMTGSGIMTGDNAGAYYGHILKNVALYFVLPSITGIEIGWLISTLEKRAVAYAIIVSIFFFAGGFAETLAGTLMLTMGIDIYGPVNVVSLFPQGLDWTPNFHFGFSAMLYQVCRCTAWIAILFIMILLTGKVLIRRKSAIILCLIGLAVLLLSSVQYFTEGSRVIYNHDPKGSLVADQWYYLHKSPVKEAAPRFSVTSYAMDLEIDRQLDSVVTVTLGNNPLKKYDFTLYHGFHVHIIESSNGTKMRFKQQGDHLTVYNPDGVELKTITFKYCGYSNQYYSNHQGVFLPAYFPYYPMPGVYDLKKREGIVKQKQLSHIEAKVQTRSGQRIFSNLKEKADRLFQGKSPGVTLMSGFVSERTDNNGNRAVFPFLSDECSPENVDRMLELICKNGYKGNTVFIVPNVNQKMSVIAYDDMILTPWILTDADVTGKER